MSNDLSYIINHVFLPSKLPQKDDSDAAKDELLMKQVLAALESLQHRIPKTENPRWNPCIKMVHTMLTLRGHSGGLIADRLKEALGEMLNGDILPLHIRCQNAGIIIRRTSEEYAFEMFEISPTNEAVIGTKGRLRRCFPGPAMAIGQGRIADASFLDPIVDLLVKLDFETPHEALPTVRKAGSKVVEIRDTVHPRFVTEMLTGILRAIGRPLNAHRIYKHTRDDVLWKNALTPWRRSPLWLFVRVALQTSLMCSETQEIHLRYKSFMLFFMTRILDSALEASVPSDILFCMTAKISRRALKFTVVDKTSWWLHVENSIQLTQEKLVGRWKSVQNHQDRLKMHENWLGSPRKFLADTKLKLSCLKPYLAKMTGRPTTLVTSHDFTLDCIPRISQRGSELPELSLLREENKSQIYLSLADLEFWTEQSLSEWLVLNQANTNSCMALAKLINDYMSEASSVYKDAPEDISLMILTTMELWVALDKCALHHCELLYDYDPGFPASVFEPLLLPGKPQMARLNEVEQHLERRRASAKAGFPSIFRSVDADESFSVRFYRQSPNHQELRRKIEAEATIERSQKLAELETKREKYQNLMSQSEGMSCEFFPQWRKGRSTSEHSSSCSKCNLKSTANALTINVHEWPLPDKDLQAMAAVFELDVPHAVSRWRDTTHGILVDMLSPGLNALVAHRGARRAPWGAHQDYDGLRRYVRTQAGRLGLRSENKPFVSSHYRFKKVYLASETSICVNNGLDYALYDSRKSKWTEELLGCIDVREQCTLKLQKGPYTELQYAVTNTTHTSNDVIAQQSECPEALTLHEFYAFGTLRSGHRLQWRNIARELVAHDLNFNRDETYTLVTQMAWQAGPSGTGRVCRESHVDLEEDKYGNSLLSVLDKATGAIEGNWQGASAARTFVTVASRLLSLSLSDLVRDACCQFLRRVRAISLSWMRELSQTLQRVQKEDELKVLNVRLLEMALTCHATFDVDVAHLPKLLLLDEDIAVVTECSIIVHDRCPVEVGGLPAPIRASLRRYWRLSYLLEPRLRQRILEAREGLDNTIQRLWTGYETGTLWVTLNAPSERWLVTKTSSERGHASMHVHYNVLDGSLLVNGAPLTRLPRLYEEHQNFRRLFGQRIFDVVPSTMSEMAFEARNEFCDHRLYFGMQNSEVLIRAKKNEVIYEILPVYSLEGDFPNAFVHDYVHWLEVATGFVEWRPLLHAWTSRPQNWQLRPGNPGEKILISGHCRLVDIHSHTAKVITKVLSTLELATFLHITFNDDLDLLEVNLPRLKLDFFMKNGVGTLESKQFRGMVVDETQSFGTLIGLVNKLVLRGRDDSSRCVIIPDGQVSFMLDDSHTQSRVEILPGGKHRIYHVYHIDTQIGRLVDNGSLKSKLFKCYLHAVTSHCLVDELTGRTGTEEALSILASPSVRSFLSLDSTEINLLSLLARLTPRREYYPQHLRVMQTVDWDKLPSLSQHSSFNTHVQSILGQAHTLSLFRDNVDDIEDTDICGVQHLLQRAAIRESVYRIHGFGAEKHTIDHDDDYDARDHHSKNPKEVQIYHVGKLVDEWSTGLSICSNLLEEIESWKEPLSGCSTDDSPTIGYNARWLEPAATFFPDTWYSLHTALSQSEPEKDKYKIMLFLCTLNYSQYSEIKLVQTLLAFATVPRLREIRLPSFPLFQLADGYKPDIARLTQVITPNARPFDSCPEARLPSMAYESNWDANERRKDEHQTAKEKHVSLFVHALVSQWPRVDLREPGGADFSTYISVNEALSVARILFEGWHRNSKFAETINNMQAVLNCLEARHHNFMAYSFPYPPYHPYQKLIYINHDDLMTRSAPSLPPIPSEYFAAWVGRQDYSMKGSDKLKTFLLNLESIPLGSFKQRYADDLLESYLQFVKLRVGAEAKVLGPKRDLKVLIGKYLKLCKDHVSDIHTTIDDCLRAETLVTRRLACTATMWPRLSTSELLQYLVSAKRVTLREDWRKCLVEYGVAITNLQRAERLLLATGDDSDLLKELSNEGHQGWDPDAYPDWLLLEIDNNILIRPVQADIAREMISPMSGTNSIMQLNMGEGKSSVIVPIVAAALADGKKLVRVVVLKPLSTQMFHLLLRKLSGLLGRRIFHMPISRSVRLNTKKVEQLRNLCEECKRTGGILLVQPEHLLSFELMGIERLLSDDTDLGNSLVETQRWLEDNTRDIFDESDEILSVRFELIYTMGTQNAIELSPDRWIIIQHLLGLVRRFAHQVLQLHPQGLDLRLGCAGSFHSVRVLQDPAAAELIKMVAREVCDAGLPGVSVWNLPESVRANLFEFLTEADVTEEDIQPLKDRVLGVDLMWKSLLLLRGLLAGGVLTFCLQQKRWRVSYGLDLSRTMLAVPYRAKDSPATRAEFSHPDTAIVLTCLSYYYDGLSDGQLHVAFEMLLLSDHAQEEYECWVQDAPELPPAFCQLSGINSSDLEQCSRVVFPYLRRAKGLIDFYMSNIVFPKEMKEFPHKLSSSGWDLARTKTFPTTGFSGTNDSRYILPLSISQCDLEPQLPTNAKVLDCLLRPENSFKHVMQDSGMESLNAESLLQMVIRSEPTVRVILDVGAQVLEWKNEEIAREWLLRVPASDAQAVVYFDDHNNLSVLNRDGNAESLMVSPFAKQMDQCLIYLDEAHTRGTDLSLPSNYRAAVTLGPNLTKDRLVQACMRMRKLGKGQSVMFCAPVEVERKILHGSSKITGDRIEVADVLLWSISETLISTKKCVPLWATQGIRYQRRHIAWSRMSHSGSGEKCALDVSKSLLEPEAQTLQDRYGLGGRTSEEQILLHNIKDESLSERKAELDAIRAKCRDFELITLDDAVLQEEQERELSPENEEERQVERPLALTPWKHSVHRDVELFVRFGGHPYNSGGFQAAFAVFQNLSAKSSLEWPVDLLVTTDFVRTVQTDNPQQLNFFLRPVHWVLTSKHRNSKRRDRVYCVIVSPWEANQLLPSIRENRKVTLHIYSPRAHLSARSLEDLSFCTVPALPVHYFNDPLLSRHTMHLNLFAGQLYLKTYEEYISMCRFLGLAYRTPGETVEVGYDGYIDVSYRRAFDELMAKDCPFGSSPVSTLRAMVAMRRKGQSFRRSHLGRILLAELLTEEDFTNMASLRSEADSFQGGE
ncbi:hypothetical protein MMC18_005865 [Xylographa bjoerkii]|nr:hypothetical protein [Xylographa bjoerkii]